MVFAPSSSFPSSETRKVGVVFDAAAKYKGKSLNKELFTGPDLLNSLVGVLLRFRNHKITLAGDVEAPLRAQILAVRNFSGINFRD